MSAADVGLFRRRAFRVVFFCTALLMVGLNIATWVLTRRAPALDGFCIAGFPFAFHRDGGDCPPDACDTYAFHPGHFIADVAIVIGVALLAGWLAAKLRRR